MDQQLASADKEEEKITANQEEGSNNEEDVAAPKPYYRPPLCSKRPVVYDCKPLNASYPVPSLVILYSKLGLHCHDIILNKETDYRLYNLDQVVVRGHICFSLGITLRAYPDPEQLFFVEAIENDLNKLNVTCSTARHPGKGDAPMKPVVFPESVYDELPEWPTEIALEDSKRFFKLKINGVSYPHWIYLYLQLLVCARDRSMSEDELSLEPLEVVIETTEEVNQSTDILFVKNAFIYITFKDRQATEPALHQAIFRRVFNEDLLTLQGDIWTGEKELSAEEEYYLKFPEMRPRSV